MIKYDDYVTMITKSRNVGSDTMAEWLARCYTVQWIMGSNPGRSTNPKSYLAGIYINMFIRETAKFMDDFVESTVGLLSAGPKKNTNVKNLT